jgi:hypothetical protein
MNLFKRNKKEHAPVDPNDRSPQLGIKYKDLLVLGSLMQQGADLTRPRHALYYLYFSGRELAEAAAADGRAGGYQCEVRDPKPEYPGQWTVVCERPDAVLDPAGVIAADDLFQAMADRLGGEFDGWEAAGQP